MTYTQYCIPSLFIFLERQPSGPHSPAVYRAYCRLCVRLEGLIRKAGPVQSHYTATVTCYCWGDICWCILITGCFPFYIVVVEFICSVVAGLPLGLLVCDWGTVYAPGFVSSCWVLGACFCLGCLILLLVLGAICYDNGYNLLTSSHGHAARSVDIIGHRHHH